MFDLVLIADLSKVPPPSVDGRAVVFLGENGDINVKLFDGTIVAADAAAAALAVVAQAAASTADGKAVAAATAANAANTKATAALVAANTADAKAVTAQAAATAADTKAVNAATTASAADAKAVAAQAAATAADTKAVNAATAANTADAKAVAAQTVANNAASAAAAAGLAADILSGANLNAARNGAVNGLLVQSVTKTVSLIGRMVRATGSLKLVATQAVNANIELNIGGLIVPFVAVALPVGTLVYSYDVSVMVSAAGAANGLINHVLAASGVSRGAEGANNAAVSGAVTTGVIAVSMKSLPTVQVTTLLSVIEVL